MPQLLQDHRRDFLWRVILARLRDANTRVVVRACHNLVRDQVLRSLHLILIHRAAHEPLHGRYRILRVDDRLPLCRLSHKALSALGERHNGRGSSAPFRVGNDNRLAAFHDGDNRVSRSQVDSDNLRHIYRCSFQSRSYSIQISLAGSFSTSAL
jgi:hypothetical protein